MTVYTTTLDSPLGRIRLLASGGALVGLYLPGEELPATGPAAAVEDPAEPTLAAAARQLAEYFAGTRREFDLPIRGAGTAFQRTVWQELGRIPYGATCSYGQVAAAIGRPSASRAVGAANGRNPIAIVVPCHRVIGASGRLTGYAGGMAAKEWLLDHEARFRQSTSTERVASGCG